MFVVAAATRVLEGIVPVAPGAVVNPVGLVAAVHVRQSARKTATGRPYHQQRDQDDTGDTGQIPSAVSGRQ